MVHGDLPRQHSVGTTLRLTGPVGLSAVNVIGTQMLDPINSGLTRWRMAVLNKYMDAAAELGRNPVSKHQIQPEYEDEQAGAGRDCQTRLARPNSQAQTRTGKLIFPVQLTTSRIDNLTRLIHSLTICVTIHPWYCYRIVSENTAICLHDRRAFDFFFIRA